MTNWLDIAIDSVLQTLDYPKLSITNILIIIAIFLLIAIVIKKR